ncbi:MAG TPA: hypothetical protein VHQ24_00440 [Lachnospiraceae bacterium]|nr:hypothetical protein [Lachnospiraceae bacterium]
MYMDFEEFTINFPELYSMIDEDVRYTIEMYPLTGAEPLRDWDSMVDTLVNRYEQMNPFRGNLEAQQFQEGFRDNDEEWWNRNRRRRFRRFRRSRFRDFDIRDIIRIIFLRKLFDRNRY